MNSPQPSDPIDDVIRGVRNNGYNDHVKEIDPKDRGHDLCIYTLTDDEAHAAIEQMMVDVRKNEMEYWGVYLPRFDWDKRVVLLESSLTQNTKEQE